MHANRAERAPVLGMERTLRGERRLERFTFVLERRTEAVAEHVEHVATVRADCALHQRMMPRKRPSCLRVLLEQPRRSLDVGEKKVTVPVGRTVMSVPRRFGCGFRRS